MWGTLNLTQAPEKIIPLTVFIFAIGILTKLLDIIFQNCFPKEAYNVQHEFDMVYISETFLDSSILTNDERLNMKGYKLVKVDNPSESEEAGVGIY